MQSSLPRPHPGISTLAVRREYERRFGFRTAFTDTEGRIGAGAIDCDCRAAHERQALCRRIVAESLRWGEPFMDLCACEHMLWGIPVMVNQQVLGGLVASASAGDGKRMTHLRKAADALLTLAIENNLTNAALLTANRAKADRERQKAEAIHDSKTVDYDYIRSVYLQEEPALIAAIREGERGTARAIINRVLVGIYFLGRRRLDLLKSLVLELVVMMSRAAVETGADPAEILGSHYRSLVELDTILDDETLTRWLAGILERIMDAIRDKRRYPSTILLGHALRHMREHVAGDINRNQVAKVAGLSPSVFSHLMREQLNTSFTELLAQYRVNRAAELLARTTDPIAEVALACGFPDQSYFTKVFKKRMGKTPFAYRSEHGPALALPAQ